LLAALVKYQVRLDAVYSEELALVREKAPILLPKVLLGVHGLPGLFGSQAVLAEAREELVDADAIARSACNALDSVVRAVPTPRMSKDSWVFLPPPRQRMR
jgi:hypothetical protein